MDQELLEYLEAFRAENTRRFDELGGRVDQLGGRVDQLGGHVDQLGGRVGELGERVDQLGGRVDQLGGRVSELGERVDGTNLEIRSLREETTQRFSEVNQEARSFREETTQRFERLQAEVRRGDVVTEGLQGTVALIAEGVTGIVQQLKRQGEEVSQRLDAVESFNRLIYKDLDSRVRKLEAS